jgi:hypothetical protein
MAAGRFVPYEMIHSATLKSHSSVAPHYFKPAELEQLATGDKKMPKAIGASSSKS